ncbi:MAG TPA: VOC family protein [Candidatus Dormibacteraeota bacterium]|nr:VOC family protein [Candidatus Dormibacteraeota bacterium]
MGIRVQLTVDCADPDRLARFWALALGYLPEEPPRGFESWAEYWISRGVPQAELAGGYDSIVDPDGVLPRIWFQQVPEGKVVKNRLHLDLEVGGGRADPLPIRKRRVDAEVARLEQAGAIRVGVIATTARDHYAVAMRDPEGNEFDVG